MGRSRRPGGGAAIGAGLLFMLALFCAACAKPARPTVTRIAFLRFENLGPDTSTDWIGRALPEAIARDLQGLADVYAIGAQRLHGFDATLGPRAPAAPGISSERAEALLAGANRIAYGDYAVRGGALEARVTLEDPATQQTVGVISVSAGGGGILEAAASVARQISPSAAANSPRNPEALKTFVQALEAGNPAADEESLRQVVAADPDFGPAYEQLAQLKLRQQDRDGARDILVRALARSPGLGAVDRARLELDLATIVGDVAARERALESLTRAAPADPLAWHDFALAQTARHQYAPAVAAFRNALRIEPESPDTLNQLGYAAAYAGNGEEAARALTRYRELQPGNPNPVDSLGDINLIAGRLREAEGYYLAAAKMNPDFLAGIEYYKASVARLMTGDVAGADTLAAQYAAERASAHDSLVELRRAQWSWMSGRRKAAFGQMEKVARDAETSAHEIASRAYAELALWSLLVGRRDAAGTLAQKAAALATPSSTGTVLLVRFLAQTPASPAEWQDRAARLAPNAAMAPFRDLALAGALLLGRQYQAAAPLLQHLYDSGQSSDESIPVLLAWADIETGRVADAAALLRFNPVPSAGGTGPFTPFYFPRLFALRGAAAERGGKTAEARDSRALFQKLSGDTPLLWDEGGAGMQPGEQKH
jgi:Flp pilus assembly protein TadD